MWKREWDTDSRCIAEEKEYENKRYENTHKEPEFIEGDQFLVSNLNFDILKSPKIMRDPLVGPFAIIKLIGKLQWRSDFQKNYLGNTQCCQSHTPQDIMEVNNSPGLVKKSIKARKIRLNGKEHRQYFVRFQYQTADKDKLLAEYSIPDGDLYLRRF
ncbi:hypothetical protein O181_106743 [Austropuccinia psidii MF-1]|uniref:Uncharacterized protein n=1 Tax=Austropuccinia psidii MF-1 TaxID=1389203 RepID=A0A9Q3JR86_9BASI|nr:hypothetical protein [Austropuccinia psidii MF-1]